MNVNAALHVISNDLQLDCANVERDEIDCSTINIEFDVDVKTHSYVAFLIVCCQGSWEQQG
jgi:hypothetical protein